MNDTLFVMRDSVDRDSYNIYYRTRTRLVYKVCTFHGDFAAYLLSQEVLEGLEHSPVDVEVELVGFLNPRG